MQLKLNTETNCYELAREDGCGLCGEDVAGTPHTVRVSAVIDGVTVLSACEVYTDAAGTMRVANTDEFVRCFT